ncbi:MAG: hypothetical protein WCW77_02725 [Patescibacteria group bacterium]|jgi:hypothetical protein
MPQSQPKKKSIDTFAFEKFELDKFRNEIRFFYRLGEKTNFVETLKLKNKAAWDKINKAALNEALFGLHLAMGVSYWKAYCPKKIIIKSGALSKAQADYWNKLYTIGLGEFYYKNKIDFRKLVKFPFADKKTLPVKIGIKNSFLVPVGGGKDSIVSAELLNSGHFNFSLFSLGDSKIQKEVSRIIGKKRILFERTLDKKLLGLKGAYNGHIPISSIYSFSALLAGILYGYKYIIFSNEQSANFGNVKYLGKNINHQYSKSFEAEKDFNNYVQKFITPDITTFSLLRPFSELKISEIFSRHKKYFPYFSSCNNNFKIKGKSKKRWCGKCPKCAFVFSQLSAFLSKKELLGIFEKNLYDDRKLLGLYLELLGKKDIKPFDCVGTPEEVTAGMELALKKGELNNSFILKQYSNKITPGIKNKRGLINAALKIHAINLPGGFGKLISKSR